MSKDVYFVTERLPCRNSSGAESYNNYICQLISGAGYRVHLIVTGDFFRQPIFSIESNLTFTSVHFLRCQRLFGYYCSTSLKSYLRPLKALLPQKAQTSKLLKIGRFITDDEASKCAKLLQEKSGYLFVDTIFRDHHEFDRLSLIKVLVAHDVFHLRSDSFKEQGYSVSPPIEAEFEAKAWNSFDAHIAINDDERAVIESVVGQEVSTVFPYFKDSAQEPTTGSSSPEKILYIGSAAHHNVHGLQHFLTNIWPVVKLHQPAAKLMVAGSIGNSFQSSKIPGVEFLGRVDQLDKVAAQCQFAINPVYMGSGVKIKVLDYLDLNLPCITTQVGLMGFVRKEEMPLVEAKSDGEFQALLMALLSQPEQVAQLKATISDYLKIFSAGNSSARLQAALTKAWQHG